MALAMVGFMELQVDIVPNGDIASKKALQPGWTHSSLEPTPARAMQECGALLLLTHTKESRNQKSSHVRRMAFRLNTMFNYIGVDCLSGARGMIA